jgi:hypothetical protein
MAYEFHWPSLIWPSKLWRILVPVMVGTLTFTLAELLHEWIVVVATTVLCVAYKQGVLFTF